MAVPRDTLFYKVSRGLFFVVVLKWYDYALSILFGLSFLAFWGMESEEQKTNQAICRDLGSGNNSNK